MNHKEENLSEPLNVFPLKNQEKTYLTYLNDFLTEHQEIYLNYKEFLASFRVHNAFEFLKQPGLEFSVSLTRVIFIYSLI